MAITRTGTRALPESYEAWWRRAQRRGVIASAAWPVVDSIMLGDDRAPVITLVSPGLIPGASHVFVDYARMSAEARHELTELLEAIRAILRSAGFSWPLQAILHAGGTSYEFQGSSGESISLDDLPRLLQPAVWALIESIAFLGVRYPDLSASRPHEPVSLSATGPH